MKRKDLMWCRQALKRVAVTGLCSAMLLSVVPASCNTVWASEVSDTAKATKAQKQTVKLKLSSKTFSTDQLEQKKKTFKIRATAKTAISYKVTKGAKYVTVDKKGNVTVKKGTKEGVYKILVTAAATDEYKKATAEYKIEVNKPQMKKVNVSWDLKKNKAVDFIMDSVTYDSTNIKKGKVTLKNLKKTSVGDKYKLTMSFVYDLPVDFSKKEVAGINKLYQEMGIAGPSWFFGVYDYQTGENLEYSNSYKVKVKSGEWKYEYGNKISGSDGSSFQPAKKSTVNVTITYPKTYKDLCIMAGGYRASDLLDGNPVFTAGNYQKTKNDSKYFHAMRIK